MADLDVRIAQRLHDVPDPLTVRATTAGVVMSARFVRLDARCLKRTCTLVGKRIRSKHLLTQDQFGSQALGPQRVFLQDVVNFCFWARKGKPRWEIEYPAGKRTNGWYGLTTVFERAIAEGIPILDAAFLTQLTLADTHRIFRGVQRDTPIPLLPKRHQFLKSAGAILSQRFQGSVKRFISRASLSAADMVKATLRAFPSFEDTATLDGKRITFYKRAQIFAYDLSLLPESHVHHLEALTAFADYKLPQLLRHMGAIRYTESLARWVDRMELVPRTSREEVEIRAATIWACELIAQELGVPATTVDNALWLETATTKFPMRPYHRTLTTCY